jgi:hypothetical protein
MKQRILDLLFQAEQLALTQARIEGLTLDEAELNDAGAEGCFEEIREKFSMLAQAVDYYVD